MTAAGITWAASATVHTHDMAPWWPEIRSASKRCHGRTVGNVTFLPAPVAGYRIRHAATGVIVEIKPSHAPAVELARCTDADTARAVLAQIAADHSRPFLGEIGRAA